DLDAEAAGRVGVHREVRAVRGGDGGDDGQAQAVAVAVGAVRGEALEGLQQPVYFVRGYGWAGVHHAEHRVPVPFPGRDVEPPVRHVVPDGVVDEVDDEPFDESRIAHRPGAFQGGTHPDPLPLDVRAVRQQDLVGEHREVDRFGPVQPAL